MRKIMEINVDEWYSRYDAENNPGNKILIDIAVSNKAERQNIFEFLEMQLEHSLQKYLSNEMFLKVLYLDTKPICDSLANPTKFVNFKEDLQDYVIHKTKEIIPFTNLDNIQLDYLKDELHHVIDMAIQDAWASSVGLMSWRKQNDF